MIRVLLVLILTLQGITGAWGAQIYVDQHTPGSVHDGMSWDTAFLTIKEGVRSVWPRGEIWVADGWYVENILLERTEILLYGGFLGAEPGGYETELEQRDFEKNSATIDGGRSSCCILVILSRGRIDGFTITNGKSNYGAGIDCYWSYPIICNNIITGNVAESEGQGGGGGIACREGSSPKIFRNIIEDNYASHVGGGIYCDVYSGTLVFDNVIWNNEAEEGGGIFNAPYILQNMIVGNSAYEGGAVSCHIASLVNNTIADNITLAGAAVDVWRLGREPGYAEIINTILWDGGKEITFSDDGWTVVGVTFSNVEGGWPGVGNIAVDPQFADPKQGDFHLLSRSPCIDAGCNGVLWYIAKLVQKPVNELTDIDGEGRVLGWLRRPSQTAPTVDIGADEFHPKSVSPRPRTD